MLVTRYDLNGELIEQFDDGQPEPQAVDLRDTVNQIREQAAKLNQTSATAVALNATADALEALIQ